MADEANVVNYSFDTTDSKFTDTKYRRDDIIRPFDEDNKLSYPLLLMSCEKLERFRVEVLKGMIKSATFLKQEDIFYVYLDLNGQKVEVGIVASDGLKSLLSNPTFKVFDKKIYLDKNTMYEGDILYAFCSANTD